MKIHLRNVDMKIEARWTQQTYRYIIPEIYLRHEWITEPLALFSGHDDHEKKNVGTRKIHRIKDTY